MLPLIKPPHSTFRLRYSGPVGVAGVSVQQTWDLTALPEAVRATRDFKQSVLVFVQQIDSGVSAVASAVSFLPVTGTPTTLVLTLSAAAPTDVLALDVWYLHSIEGLAAGSQAYFIAKPSVPSAPAVGTTNVARLDSVLGNDATAAVGSDIPYKTLQAAVNACKAAHDALGPVDSAARFRSGYVIDPAPFTQYDEDVTIDVTNGFHLQITGRGGWMLGVFDAVNWAPNAVSNRSITITGDSRALTEDIRPSVIIGSLDSTPYFGTNHLAWYGPRIAGQIKIDLVTGGQPLSGHCEFGLNCEIFGNTFAECVDMNGKNPIITLQLVNARFRKAANFGTASNIFGAWRSRFSGLLTCNTWATFNICRFQAGFTCTGDVAVAFPPAGFFSCGMAGTYTGPAGKFLRLDLASNTSLVEGGNVIVGWTKKLLNDATP